MIPQFLKNYYLITWNFKEKLRWLGFLQVKINKIQFFDSLLYSLDSIKLEALTWPLESRFAQVGWPRLCILYFIAATASWGWNSPFSSFNNAVSSKGTFLGLTGFRFWNKSWTQNLLSIFNWNLNKVAQGKKAPEENYRTTELVHLYSQYLLHQDFLASRSARGGKLIWTPSATRFARGERFTKAP